MVNIKFRLVVLGVLALVFGMLSAAAEAETLSWVPPETRVDGTPLSLDEIGEYRLVCSEVVTSIQPGQTEYEIAKHKALPGYGDNTCHMTVVDTGGLESGPSNEVVISYEKARPEALTIRLL